MRVMAQMAMVMNLDKCIGCHTCSVTCKNVWTNREGVEYAWFNNVETKPGIGYPKEWENQDRWNGGWVRKANGQIEPRQGGKLQLLLKPTHLIGGYAQLCYGFNYYGPTGNQRDEVTVIRRRSQEVSY